MYISALLAQGNMGPPHQFEEVNITSDARETTFPKKQKTKKHQDTYYIQSLQVIAK